MKKNANLALNLRVFHQYTSNYVRYFNIVSYGSDLGLLK